MFNYKKIIVVGCPGSGKSIFSRKLHQATGIELFHLDSLYWNTDCSHISRSELIEKTKEILKKESYIIDGNFKSTLELRIAEADAVFFFDLPVETCIKGALERKYGRPEMPCKLPADNGLIDFIKSFDTDIRPLMINMFNKYNANVIAFHSHTDADKYIKSIKPTDLTLKTEKGIFNHRVAAIIIHKNKLLAQKNTETNEYYLAGGRVRFGESSEQALVREVREELGVTITNFKPLWINECFFFDSGRPFHEIGVYYLADVSNTCFNNYETVFETQEENRTNTYEWLEINRLDEVKLYPLFIKEEIKKPMEKLKLIITRENPS